MFLRKLFYLGKGIHLAQMFGLCKGLFDAQYCISGAGPCLGGLLYLGFLSWCTREVLLAQMLQSTQS